MYLFIIYKNNICYFISAVRRLIAYKIIKKVFYNMCVFCVYLLCIYKYTHTVYILKIMYLYVIFIHIIHIINKHI